VAYDGICHYARKVSSKKALGGLFLRLLLPKMKHPIMGEGGRWIKTDAGTREFLTMAQMDALMLFLNTYLTKMFLFL
jgi:hypothetical protein